MPVKRGIDILTVHTDEVERSIWFGTGGSLASVWEGSGGIPEFIAEPWVTDAGSVRVLGTSANAELIVSLYNQRLTTGLPQFIKIGSPGCCRNLRDIVTVFHDMMENALPPSVGGWHELAEADYRTYAALAAYQKDGKLSDRVLKLLEVHPAIPALTFIPSINWDYAIEFLDLMVDPRFHIDRKYPDRNGQLKSFFGLGRGTNSGIYNVRAFLSGREEWKHDSYHRARVVLGTWYNDVETVIGAGGAVSPDNFLMRVVRQMLVEGDDRADQDVVAVLKASHIFLRFVKEVWLDSLTPPRHYELARLPVRSKPRKIGDVPRMLGNPWYNPTLFVPEYFFKFEDELRAWWKHTS